MIFNCFKKKLFFFFRLLNLFKSNYLESLRLLSLNDNKYLRYFKGHHDRYIFCSFHFHTFFDFRMFIISLLSSRVVSLSLCPRNECFISGSSDRTVLLWDQRIEKSQVKRIPLKKNFDLIIF